MNYKKLLFAALSFILITTAISCKKDDTPPLDPLPNTTWTGTFAPLNSGGDPIAIKFEGNKKVTFFFDDLNAPVEKQNVGTYTFANNELLFSVINHDNTEKMSFSGTLTNNTIDGTWGEGDAIEGGGVFNVTKQ